MVSISTSMANRVVTEPSQQRHERRFLQRESRRILILEAAAIQGYCFRKFRAEPKAFE
jgi:hypothetical protein